MESKKCAVCSVVSVKRCGGCHLVFYCSRDHQRQHWPTHRSNCKLFKGSTTASVQLFKVEVNKSIGRFLVAAQKIPPLKVILREKPLMKCPKYDTPPVCLGCFKLLSADCVSCPRCGWPMCSLSCADSPDHVAECHITVKIRGKKVSITKFGKQDPMYIFVMFLRALYIREENPECWKKLLKLETHSRIRSQKLENWEKCFVCMASLISNFKLTSLSEEEIMHIYGIFQVNAYEKLASDISFVAVYEWASMLEHSCYANCSCHISNGGELIIQPTKPIEPGEHLTVCYMNPLWSRERRRKFLARNKFFWCRCQRCVDPTEMGTYFSALRCPQLGCDGLCVPNAEWLQLESAADKEDEEPPWLCERCQQPLLAKQAQECLTKAAADFATVDPDDPYQCLEFLRRQESAARLSPQHSYLTMARLTVAHRLGQDVGLMKLSKEELDMKEQLCRQVLQLLGTLCPAMFLVRGSLLVELQTVLWIRIRDNVEDVLLGSPSYRELVQVSHKMFLEARELLRYCLNETDESKAMTIKVNICFLEKEMQRLQCNPDY